MLSYLNLLNWLDFLEVLDSLARKLIKAFIQKNKEKSQGFTLINSIEKAIAVYLIRENELPDSLADISMDLIRDPWGRPYRYLRIDGGTTSGIKGKRRRDKNANPVNSDYDLYSMGQDGKTTPQFTAKDARDDIVRANDGRYIGLAEDH